MEVKIDSKRLKELEKTEKIMRALEASGVDNWEGYEIALDRLESDFKKEELVDETTEEILENICEYIDEPAGSGAGYGFHNGAEEVIENVLKKFIKGYNKL